jgi:hypothetical protein
MKLVVNNTLKPFVNNPELYTPFIEEIAERIDTCTTITTTFEG